MSSLLVSMLPEEPSAIIDVHNFPEMFYAES